MQFAPHVGDVNNNLNRADAVLNKANPKDLDLLVLPELAFSGYNFRSLQHINPFLEPTAAGITSLWARTTALKYNCIVSAGYPEKVDVSFKWPAGPEYYNSSITVNSAGETLANYRKSFLYYTDEKWALEGSGFYAGRLGALGKVAMGICMDLNPYKFEAPWRSFEFSKHIIRINANLVILSMAWLTREDARSYNRAPRDPDMETLSYWLARLEPVIRAESKGEIIVVLANRCGVEDEAVYAGTSCVLGIQDGEVKVYGILGRGEKELLVVDTSKRPQAKLVSEPTSFDSVSSGLSVDTDVTVPSPATTDASSAFTDEFDDYFASPVSPINANSPQTYFDTKRFSIGNEKPNEKPNGPLETLKSSIAHLSAPSPRPDSFILNRPESPKSRKSSRAREPLYQDPALKSHDLAQEPQTTHSALKSPPHSASAIPDQEQLQTPRRSGSLGPRSQHVSPRPKSAVR